MLDKKLCINDVTIQNNSIEEDVSIKVASDLHLCDSFDNSKLEILEDYLTSKPTDYIFMPGDVIDSTNFLYTNTQLKLKYLKFLERIAKNTQTFIGLGSHDFTKKVNGNWVDDWSHGFWSEVNAISSNIHLSQFESFYEDEYIIVSMLNLGFEYYYNFPDREDREELIKLLKSMSSKLHNLHQNKLKVVINHSPTYMRDAEVLELLKEFDMFVCGHMHNGCWPLGLDKILPGHRGLIAPQKYLFPKNARGVINIDGLEKEQHLIVSGGVTKLQECSGIAPLNKLFTMDVEDINVKTLNFKK